MTPNYFLKMILALRQREEIMLYDNILTIAEADAREVGEFLKQEYEQEALDYPYKAPPFNPEAALWAAKTVYIAAQLILYRKNKEADLKLLVPDFTNTPSSSAILSCDLCLRFVPDMIVQLKLIDSEDALIEVLENKLRNWHYSAINYPLEIEKLDFNFISDPCLQQLYVNRIIAFKKMDLARHNVFKEMVLANLGMFAQEFWKDFKIETVHE